LETNVDFSRHGRHVRRGCLVSGAKGSTTMRIVILGAGYAGVTCAVRLARKSRGQPVEITLVNGTDRLVERIRLHEQAAGRRPPEHDLRGLLRGTGVALRVGWVTAIDLETRTVSLGDEPLGWDRLVLALGSRTDVDGVPGIREHAFTLDATSTARLAAEVPAVAARGGRVVVIGGGLTGIEAATELAERHPSLKVVLLTRGRVAEGWSEAARTHLLRTFTRLGIELREGASVTSIAADRVETSHGAVPFDLCVWSVGFAAPSLAREAGLAVNERGQVLLDPMLRSISHPHVYAAGDVACPVEPPGDPMPMGCKSAGPTGAHVADDLARLLAGKPERPFDYAVPLYCVSLGRRDALVQTTGPGGAPTGRVLTGRLAVWIKELICKGTIWILHLERRGLLPTMWARTGRAPALPSSSTAKERVAA
jgi:NADH dehydrogenase